MTFNLLLKTLAKACNWGVVTSIRNWHEDRNLSYTMYVDWNYGNKEKKEILRNSNWTVIEFISKRKTRCNILVMFD